LTLDKTMWINSAQAAEISMFYVVESSREVV
jgi:hypothetical protein